MSTLAQLEVRVSARLVDASNAIFALTTIDEALRSALSEYSAAWPQAAEGTLTLPDNNNEINLSSLTSLIGVSDVWWPFGAFSPWPANQIDGFRLRWNGAAPWLLISSNTTTAPAASDLMHVWYTKPHTINGLDGAGATTVLPLHETWLVTGAAGYAVASEMRHQIGSIHVDPTQVAMLEKWATDWLLEFRTWLETLAVVMPPPGPPFGAGWGTDKLSQLRKRVAAQLMDTVNAAWTTTTIDEALTTALAAYSEAIPFSNQTYLTLAALGREISLSTLTGLIAVLDVWWPYDHTTEKWPPNQVAGYRVYWDNALPVLFLDTLTANQPQIGDQVRLWYTKPHTIAGLGGAGATTIFPLHESGIVSGAAAFAAAALNIKQAGGLAVDAAQLDSLHKWSTNRLKDFRAWLAAVAASAPSSGPTFAPGWGIDKWDSNRNPRSSQYPTW